MPSGKPRSHRRNPGGRPSNKERLDDLHAQINTLRQLLYHRKLQDETWHMIHRLLTLINELDDLATPLKSATWEGTGHAAEQPLLPGVQLAPAVGDPGYDPDRHKGNRDLSHAGTYAADLNKWFHRQVRWTIATTENRLKGKEADPRPRMPTTITKADVERRIASYERFYQMSTVQFVKAWRSGAIEETPHYRDWAMLVRVLGVAAHSREEGLKDQC